MKKILVPTDFSKLSKVTFNTAKVIAEKTDAEIHLLHGSFLLDKMQKSIAKEKQINEERSHIAKLEKLSRNANKENLKTETHYCNTHFLSKIVSFSENEFDLIVMGTDDFKNQDEYLKDSNALKVVRLTQCPVLVIKSEAYRWKNDEIIFASDFNKEIFPVFEELVDFAKLMNMKINLVRIGLEDKSYKKIEDIIEPFAAICPEENFGIVWEHNDSTIAAGLKYVCKKFNYCPIAIGSHHREYDNLFYDDAVSETIVFEAEVPVLTFPIFSELLV